MKFFKNLSSFFLFVLLVFVLIIQCKSQTDYNCVSNFYMFVGQSFLYTTIQDICNNFEFVVCDDSYNVLKLNGISNGNYQISGNLLSCFYFINEIQLENCKVDSNFLTTSSFFYQQDVKVNLTNPISYSLEQPIVSSISSLSIYTQNVYTPTSGSLSFDIFKDLKEFNFVDTSNLGQQSLYFSPATTYSNIPKSFNLFSKTLPSLQNMEIENIIVDLQKQFTWSFSDFQTYSVVTNTIDISSNSLDTCILSADLFSPSNPMQAKELNIKLCIINDPLTVLNVSFGYPQLEKLKIITNQNFNSNSFPINVVPETLEEFTFQGAQFSSLESAYDALRYVKSVKLSQNTITTNTLPENTMSPGANIILDLSYNGLTGTVPESYCKIEDLDVSYNLLDGEIPECFHCYYQANKFINNQFSNINQIGNCENKIKPTLRIETSSKKIYLEGKNLGFSNQITTSPPLVWFMQIPSELFIADYSQYILELDKTFTLSFDLPMKTFTVRTIRTTPTVSQAIAYKNGTIQFIGQDFIYDYSKMSIIVGQFVCEIQSSSYNQVICQLLNYVPSQLTANMKTLITVIDNLDVNKNYTRQIMVTFNYPNDYTNNIVQCVGDCYGMGTCYTDIGSCICNANLKLINQNTCQLDCGQHGTFNTETAKCVCSPNYSGQYCDVDDSSCPNSCSGYGTCISSTCSCIDGRTGSDCSGYTCPNNCTSSSHGTCNSSDGTCQCISNYDGLDCSSMKCPNDCSNAGVCNKNNGTCTCKNGRTSSDCSLYTCPNDCTSSSHGNCNSSDGTCQCISNYDGLDCSTMKCPDDCSNAGVCNKNNGTCTCKNGRTLSNCSGYSCPNDCSKGGDCDVSTGSCTCYTDRVFLDCSGFTCKENCLNGGSCNNTIGSCVCKANWKGPSCSTPVHYISSIDPCSVSGGQVIIYGWFGSIHTGLKITIGDLECTNATPTESMITCYLDAGSGTKNVNITQNDSSFIGKNKFQYYNPVMKCLNNCTDELKGTCDTSNGQCICTSLWSGPDCSLKSKITSTSSNNQQQEEEEIPKSITAINVDTGAASISNQDVNYEISIISLVEFDLSGNQVKTNLLQKKWKTSVQNLIYQFSQTIDNQDDDISSDKECLVTYTIEEVNKTKNYDYAGLKLTIEEGGIKVSVNISNYQFKNALNTLQLRFLSAAGQDKLTSSSEENQCNKEESKTNTDNIDPNQTLNYISITKNNKQLYGRFINKLESDSRYTFMTSEVIKDLSNSSSIVVGLNLPHCVNYCYLDPDFSVLVSSNFKSKCSDIESDNKKWVIPVAVVIPCVALVGIFISSFLVYRKYRYQIRLFVHKKSNMSLRNSFKLKKKNPYGYKD